MQPRYSTPAKSFRIKGSVREEGQLSGFDMKASGADLVGSLTIGKAKAEGLSGPGKVRVNKAGCLDRCAGGPVAVVYPEAVWYTFVDSEDIDEIVESHLKNGQVVERLLLPPNVGR